MSYSGGFGHAPRHPAAHHHAPRHNEHRSRRSHVNMERAMMQYEGPIGGEPSQRGTSPYDLHEEYPREEYSRAQRRSAHGYNRMQENRAHRFPNEYDFNSNEPHLILTSHRGYVREDESEVDGGPNDLLGYRLIRFENGRRRRVGIYAQPDNEPANHDYGSQNCEGSMQRFNGGRALSAQSRRTPRNTTRPHHEHVRESHDLAGTDSAEWWAEYDRYHMRPTPNHQFIGYLTQPHEYDSSNVFVTNPYLTGRMAALAARVAAHGPCG